MEMGTHQVDTARKSCSSLTGRVGVDNSCWSVIAKQLKEVVISLCFSLSIRMCLQKFKSVRDIF